MKRDLIESSELTSTFLGLMGDALHATKIDAHAVSRSGPLRLTDLDEPLQTKIKALIKNSALTGNGFADLFEGSTDRFDGNHSSADYALIQAASASGFTPDQCDQALRASGLYRDKWDSRRGHTTYGWQTINRVFTSVGGNNQIGDQVPKVLSLADFVPQYVPGGMPAREFVGPKIAIGAHLFPSNALSAMVAIGGGAKTSSIMSLAAHVAAGRHWKGCAIKATKVIIFAVEESQEELNRKFSAIVDSWPEPDQERVIANLRLVSLHGYDARFIHRDFSDTRATEWPERIANLALEFGINGDGLIFLDHYQGFANGDLNTSDTATAMCREGNTIVAKTGAAVVFTAHIPKAQIGNNELTQGMASGSFAFENAMRQVVVLLPMSVDEAKKFDMVEERKQYIKLGFTKNSYGAIDAECWLKKVHVSTYHTIRVDPVDLVVPVPQARRSANDKLADAIIRFIADEPYVSKNMIDRESGKDGRLGESKEKCRIVLKGLIEGGIVSSHKVSDDERVNHRIPKQVSEVLRVS